MLLKEIKSLKTIDGCFSDHVAARVQVKEESLETKQADELWSEVSGDAVDFVSTSTYMVRRVEGSTPSKYEVFRVIGTSSKPFGTFNAKELADTLKPLRPNQTPDVEGFVIYTDPSRVEAVKYQNDPVKVEITDGKAVVLNKGDYFVRTVDGSNFSYSVEPASDFEATMKKA